MIGMKTIFAAILSLAICMFAANVLAQSHNTIIVPFVAGGIVDTMARVIAHKLDELTNDVYIVENRRGTNGIVGSKFAAKAEPDGKTWLLSDESLISVNPLLYPKDPGFDPEKDLKIVRSLGFMPLLLVVNPKVMAAKTVKEFVEYAKAHKVFYASAGSPGHLAMEYLADLTGIQVSNIAYNGGPPALNDLISGEVGVSFIALPNALPFVKSGLLVALATSSAKRSPLLSDVPTMAESGYPEFVVETGYFAILPAAAPPDVEKKTDDLLVRVLSDASVQQRLRETGLDVRANMNRAESMKWIAAERDRWQTVIRKRDIRD